MITGIVIALPEELRTLTAQKLTRGECVFINEQLLVAYAGAGAENAKQSAQLLLQKGATALVSWGCAAALSPTLKPGDLLLADEVLTAQNQSIAVNVNWQQRFKNQLPLSIKAYHGRLVESLTIVATSVEKQALYQRSKAVAVDMESAAVAQVARQRQCPFLVIRTIADPVDMDLPQTVMQAVNSKGEIMLTKLFSYLFTHPREIPALIKLGQHFNAAQVTLKKLAKQHLNDLTTLASN